MKRNFNCVDDVISFFNEGLENFGVRAYVAELIVDGVYQVGFDEVSKSKLIEVLPIFNPLDLTEIEGMKIPKFLVDERVFFLVPLASKPVKFFKVDNKRIGFYCRVEETLFKCIFAIAEETNR